MANNNILYVCPECVNALLYIFQVEIKILLLQIIRILS